MAARGSTLTSDFRQEFEVETTSLLRRRMLWLLIVAAVATGLIWAKRWFIDWQVHAQTFSELTAEFRWGLVGLAIIGTLVAIDAVVYAFSPVQTRRRDLPIDRMLKLSVWFVVYRGLAEVGVHVLVLEGMYYAPFWAGFYHLLACVFLPWSPLQALKPAPPILVGQLLVFGIVGDAGVVDLVWSLFLILALMAPGVTLCWLRHGRRVERLTLRFLQHRYGEIRRELVDARRLHEDLFPKPSANEAVRFTYEFEPMQQIGGDFVCAWYSPPKRGTVAALNVVVLDVTGHGVAAALTVNRLSGEIERLFAEDPDIAPGEVLAKVNRYVHLTLAPHSIYATAFCARFEPWARELEYASGGHPPGFLRLADGRVEQLESTSFVLGACPAEAFDPAPSRVLFEPGDRLVVYTDGATEAVNSRGRMLGVLGLQSVVAGARPTQGHSIATGVLGAVERYREGPPRDDTLIVELFCPVEWGDRRLGRSEEATLEPGAGVETIEIGRNSAG